MVQRAFLRSLTADYICAPVIRTPSSRVHSCGTRAAMQFVEHHCILINESMLGGCHHSSYEVLDLDAVVAGHDIWLKRAGTSMRCWPALSWKLDLRTIGSTRSATDRTLHRYRSDQRRLQAGLLRRWGSRDHAVGYGSAANHSSIDQALLRKLVSTTHAPNDGNVDMTLEVLIDTLKLDPEKWLQFPEYKFRQYFLWRNEQTGASIALLDYEPGGGIPVKHSHASNQFMYCLDGEYEYTDSQLILRKGSFYMNPKDHPHGRRWPAHGACWSKSTTARTITKNRPSTATKRSAVPGQGLDG